MSAAAPGPTASNEALVLLGTADRDIVEPGLNRLGLRVVERPEPGSPPALVVAEPSLLAAKGLLSPSLQLPPLLVKSGPVDRATLAACIELPSFFALLARGTMVFQPSLERAVQSLRGNFPLPMGRHDFETQVSGSGDRERILAEVEGFLGAAGIRSRAIARVVNAIEELITNAVYDAPTDPSGQRLYLETDRRQAVTLAAGQFPTLGMTVAGQHVRAVMRDPFGSLDANVFKGFLARGLRGDFADKAGGAGLGFARIYAAVDDLHVHVERGRSTTIGLAIDAGVARRDPGSRPNDLLVVAR